MSRYEFESEDKRYLYVIGVDNVQSVFVQLYDQSIQEEDHQLVFRADNCGVATHVPKKYKFETGQQRVIDEMREAFDWAAKSHNPYPNIDEERLYNIALAFGISITKTEIYSILD